MRQISAESESLKTQLQQTIQNQSSLFKESVTVDKKNQRLFKQNNNNLQNPTTLLSTVSRTWQNATSQSLHSVPLMLEIVESELFT